MGLRVMAVVKLAEKAWDKIWWAGGNDSEVQIKVV